MAWSGSTVLITGGSAGIGRAVALAASRRGARVGLIARTERHLVATARSLPNPGEWAAADVTDTTSLAEALGELDRRLGPPTVVVNAVGADAWGAFLEQDPDEFDRVLEVNFSGVVNTVRLVLPGMVDRRFGHIVTVASLAGRVGAPFEAAYSAAMFATVGFTEALAAEVRPLGVRCSLVHPGRGDATVFERRQTPARAHGHGASPAEVAEAVIRTVEDDRFEQMVPSRMRMIGVTRVLSPRLHRWATDRTFAAESAAMGTRLELRRTP